MSDKPEHPLRRWRKLQEPKKRLRDLAKDMGVTPSHLSEIENWNNEPSFALAARLHRATGIEMTEFERPEVTP